MATEISDQILSYLDARQDVVSFALLSKHFRSIASPRHLEYREIRVTLDNVPVWKHLARFPSLAANVRELVIHRHSHGEWYATYPPRKPRVPKALVEDVYDHWSLFDEDADTLGRLMEEASRNMVNLSSVKVYTLPHDSDPGSLLGRFLRICYPSLESFIIDGDGVEWDVTGTKPQESRLKTFIASVSLRRPFYFESLVNWASSLQVLECSLFNSGYIESLVKCHFPALRELKWTGYFPHSPPALQFLAAHPTLERLSWMFGYLHRTEVERENFLPNLRHICVTDWRLVAAVLRGAGDDAGALESVDCHGYLASKLAKGSGRSVRRLRIKCQDAEALQAIAATFPSVTHLNIQGGIRAGRVTVEGTQTKENQAHERSRGDNSYKDHRPTLEDVVDLFPALEVLGGMQFEDDEHMQEVFTMYPRLRAGFEVPDFGKAGLH
ncbi:hypothetical protein BV25DRAFT_1913209 [Artomyces pyxidatus]|uniref:Uncharacterized protein n=1 Tax=Artomyces pyxidatus TaxID=48021 RepID=A0ACB8TCT5_9AGAM|nr:hypothetical protein BV25DRAFT_1913209 [Artomyces pyxidatus]